MKKTQAQLDWWDWPSVALLFVLLQAVASRLVITNWTKNLGFAQTLTSMGFVVGLALGYSHFKSKTARWLSFGYLFVILPLILIRVIDKSVAPEERFISVGGRLWHSLIEFFARKPVEDSLFFVSVMCVVFWIISASAGFHLIRHRNFLGAILPAAFGLLVIQNYDNFVPARLLFLAFYIFIALCLLGRLNFLQNQKQWRERRVFLSPENSVDLTNSMAIAACLLIITSWALPLSIPRVDSLRDSWQHITKPWTDFTNRMHNAVSALESTRPGTPTDFYGTQLELGRGFPLSDTVMFKVNVPDLPFDQRPPRYYWRGRTYDYFDKGQWHVTGTTSTDFSPGSSAVTAADIGDRTPARFVFSIGEARLSLLYSPSQPVWFSRPGSFFSSQAGVSENIISWNAIPALQAGETYQVDAVLNDPTIEDLRAADTQYPEWITERYLELPEKFSPRIQTLASEITAQAVTPYDKALAITQYLRNNIEYTPTVSRPPFNADPLEWMLFTNKKGYCVYYASAEVLMLRSLGIPARMAVGFAQGTTETVAGGGAESSSASIFTVRKKDAHAWPEVYFPNIGWVEFEPTASQAPLDRPLAARADTNNGLNSAQPLAQEDTFLQPDQNLPDQISPTNTDQNIRIPPTLYLIPSFIALAALIIFLGRRYNLPARVPAFVRTTMERNGMDVPVWIIRWERWSNLSSIERSFESINFGLRWVKQPAPVHATPIERANNLAKILPHLEHPIKVLLDEHQTSLYTSRTADEKLARRVARQLRIQVILALLRHLTTGQYEPQATT